MTAPRARTLAALFVAGTIAGAGAVALASSASSTPPSLVAGPLLNADFERSAEGLVTLTVEVFNSSEQDLPVEVRSFAGWPVSGGATDAEVLSAGTWAELELTAAPLCDGVLAEVMAVDVGSQSLDVALDQGIAQSLQSIRDEYCGLDPYVFATLELESATTDDRGLRADLRLLGHGRGPVGDLQIVGAGSGVPGTTFDVVNLPAAVLVDGSTRLDAYWTVDDCTAALQAIMHPSVMFITDEEVRVEASLDDRAVAALARYIASECTA